MLTAEGAANLDESGILQPGIPSCSPEGDAGIGMVATNSVQPRTGNVFMGTSAFAMLVLEKLLQKLYREIDIVMTPAGDLFPDDQAGFAVFMKHYEKGLAVEKAAIQAMDW